MSQSRADIPQHSKRDDLQGIRGAAILYVLVMHLRPSVFRIGFIGVDMFFVLSGFLMTKILCEKDLSPSSIKMFYLRRFKRIIPLYMLIVVATYIYCYFALMYPDRKQVLDDLAWVSTFVSNCQPIFQTLGYWDQLSTYRFFVHTWSLAVELQYYLIVPVIIGSAMMLSSRARLAFFIVLAISSLSFQLFTPPKISYGFLASRIWQFMCGSIAYELSNAPPRVESGKTYKPLILHEGDDADDDDADDIPEANDADKKSFLVAGFTTIVFAVLTVMVITSPKFMDDYVARILSTFLAAFVIYLDSNAYCFSNNVIVYCGDISYVLYLVHWPIIVAVRYYNDNQHLSASAVLLVVLLSFAISIAVHHSIEKFFIANGFLPAVLCVLACYVLIVCTVQKYAEEPVMPVDHRNISKKEYAIKWNLMESKKVYYPHPCSRDNDTEKYTGNKGEPELRCVAEGNGTANILLIGNSIAYRAYPLIHDILAGRFKKLRLYSRSSCPPLANYCADFSEATRKVVQHEKPDILMNIHHSLHKPFVEPIKDLKTDKVFNEFQSNVNFYRQSLLLYLRSKTNSTRQLKLTS
ncbi:hypothetical protein Q1695_013412 [Nippostrongylus brasiliensis]|nr:hypothetical protein Q1695_013412 [Nippostrongylus brasiliensis]